MSEDERKKRFSYRTKRKHFKMLLAAVLIILLIATLLTGIIAYIMDNTYYVNYSEKSAVDYGVSLKENDFYEDSYLGKDYTYIASLIDKFYAEFNYEIKMDSKESVNFNYNYRVDAILQIKNKTSGKVLFAPVYNEISEKSYTITDNAVKITDLAIIDYAKYNNIAERFINTYNLDGTNAELLLQMRINVTGTSDEFFNDKNSNSHIASISIPLTSKTVEVKITSAIPAEEQKILSYTTKDVSEKFSVACKILAIISAVFAVALWTYTYFSRNIDVTYDIKVAKIVRSYKSFIQRLFNPFNTEGYQILLISTFEEMLDIRDTIQSPILMHENADKTLTKFFIPTNTKLLYIHEIKVDDYDEIYSSAPDTAIMDTEQDPDESITKSVNDTEAAIVATETVEELTHITECETAGEALEPACVPVAIPSGLVTIIEPEQAANGDGDVEVSAIECIDKKGDRIKIACRRSFTANLIQSNPQVKFYYSEIKNKILSFRGVKARTSWICESFNKGRKQLFKLKIRGKTICLYCALEPNEFDRAKYFHEEATAKAYANVPMLVRVRSDRGLKKTLGLVDVVMSKFAIAQNSNHTAVDYPPEYPYATTAELVERGLIKLLHPEAVAAEPKPHHHVHKKLMTVEHNNVVEEITIFDEEIVTPEEIREVAEAPVITLEEIDYDEGSEPTDDIADESEEGVDVIGVVWPEKPHKNKIYRYDPDGESIEVGDTVIVPTRDASRNRDVVRRAIVAHGNHKVLPEAITHPLKKIIGIIKLKSD